MHRVRCGLVFFSCDFSFCLLSVRAFVVVCVHGYLKIEIVLILIAGKTNQALKCLCLT